MSNKVIAICALLSLIVPSILPGASSAAAAANWVAASANWVEVQRKPARATYIDANSIRTRGHFRDVWEKTVEAVTDPNRVAVEITRSRYDCAKRQGMTLYDEGFLKNGDLFSSGGIPESQRIWDEIVPGSTAEALLKYACAH